jgi:hypothetical protein
MVAELSAGSGAGQTGRDLVPIAIVLTIAAVVAGSLDVLLVLLAIEQLGMGEAGAGYLSAALGLGTVGGGAATVALAGRGSAGLMVSGALCGAWGSRPRSAPVR